MSSTAPVAARHDDDAYCQAILPEVSRTFALSIEALPDGLSGAVRTSYLLCRIVDTVEDDPALRPAAREALFDAFDAQLADDGADPAALERAFAALGPQGTPDARLCARAGAVLRTFRRLPEPSRQAIRPHVLTMSRGMRSYARRGDGRLRPWIRSAEDLERYCYYVAGTVGELLTALFEAAVPGLDPARRQALRGRAVSFGLGLQLVNVLKDVAADHEEGRCFLPADLAAARGLELARLLEPESRAAGLELLGELSRRARAHLAAARDYTLLWPLPGGRDVRLFCALPLALALATLEAIERGPDTLLRGREPRIPRPRTLALVEAARAAVESDAALARFLDGAGAEGR